MIEFIEFTDDKSKNRDELAKGVVDIKCTYVGHLSRLPDNKLPMAELANSAHPGWIFGTVEMYANGRANVYVKVAGQDVAIGFLRVTPDA